MTKNTCSDSVTSENYSPWILSYDSVYPHGVTSPNDIKWMLTPLGNNPLSHGQKEKYNPQYPHHLEAVCDCGIDRFHIIIIICRTHTQVKFSIQWPRIIVEIFCGVGHSGNNNRTISMKHRPLGASLMTSINQQPCCPITQQLMCTTRKYWHRSYQSFPRFA